MAILEHELFHSRTHCQEKATGQPLGALLHARAIDRAELKSTFFDGSDTIGAPLARGFDGTNADATFADDPSFTWAAGAMVASGADLAEWIDALYAGISRTAKRRS